jgi:hypothetical protein
VPHGEEEVEDAGDGAYYFSRILQILLQIVADFIVGAISALLI